jgi:hypothetical protein
MDRDITVTEPVNDAQGGDLERWLPETRVGEVSSGPLNPVRYEVADAAPAYG